MQKKRILHIDLGARFRACPLYIAMGYKVSLMIQVFDFETIDDVRNANSFNLKEITSWQDDAYGFVFFDIPQVDEKYIKDFESKIDTIYAQFIFQKDLDDELDNNLVTYKNL